MVIKSMISESKRSGFKPYVLPFGKQDELGKGKIKLEASVSQRFVIVISIVAVALNKIILHVD